jgi:alpha-ketoglutarate-dependent taurine dioxygenase
MNVSLKTKHLVFNDYFVDVTKKDFSIEVVKRLNHDGLVTFDNISSREELVNVCNSIGKPLIHPHGNSDGVTIVESNTDVKDNSNGNLGLTSGALNLHTDRPATPNTPEILALFCVKQATEGGETSLVDMKNVYITLSNLYPDVLKALLGKENVIYKGDSHYPTSIFNLLKDRTIQVRFRYDELGYFSPSIINVLPLLLKVIQENTVIFKLDNSQGYFLQNGRWLHGRNSFKGDRKLYRIHLNSLTLPNKEVNKGFIL